MPLDTLDTPATTENGGGPSGSTSASAPLTTTVGEAAGDFFSALSANKAKMLAGDEKKDNPQPQPEAVVPDKSETASPPEDKSVPVATETKSDKDAKPDPNYGKARVRYSELPPEKREYLLAGEARKLEQLNTAETRATTAEEKANALEVRVKELEAIAETAPKERDEYKGKFEKLHQTYEEKQRELAAADVTRTDEYRQNVTEPWNREVIAPLVAMQKAIPGFPAEAALAAINAGDQEAFYKILGGLKGEIDRDTLKEVARSARPLINRHGEYQKKGADALKEITERRTTAETRAMEAHRTEVERARKEIVANNAKRFPFLDVNDKNLPPELKAELEKSDERIKNFDFAKLTPAEQAGFIEAGHKGFFAANYLDGLAGHFAREAQAAKDELAAEKAKVADLEKRLGNKESTALVPGRNGDAPRNAPKPAEAKDTMDFFAKTRAAMAGAR